MTVVAALAVVAASLLLVAHEADPLQEPGWYGIHYLSWSSVVSTVGQLAGGVVVNDEPVPYAVRVFPGGPAGDELGTVLDEPGPGGGERIRDGEASHEDGSLVSTFPLGLGSSGRPGWAAV